MKKLYAILFLVALIHTGVYGQAKKPTIMVVPANVWCTHNGYTQKYNNQGTITEIPDYKKALDNDLNVSVSAILSCRPFFILIFLPCIKMNHYGFSRKSIWKNLETFP